MNDPYDQSAYEIMKNDYIENEMHKTKEQVLKSIAKYLVHSNFSINDFSSIAENFFEENDNAMKIAHELDLGKLEFLAVLEDFDSFKDLYMKEQEQEIAQNF